MVMNYTTNRKIAKGTRVLVAMSGGVDSSLAAYRLKKDGFEVVGVTMNLKPPPAGETGDSESQSPGAYEEAVKVAADIGIEHHVLDLHDVFEKRVMEPTRLEYGRGRTPNPCVMCNRFMKFEFLMEKAKELGCEYIATGHYARVVKDNAGWHILRGIDQEKDQSYFLAFLTSEKLERILFPLGWDTKESIRREAEGAGLSTARRPESQDLCFFTPGSEGNEFGGIVIEDKPGDIVTTKGEVVGQHEGISGYTIGQRKGIPGGMVERMYVVEIDPVNNRIVVGTDDECYSKSFKVDGVSFVDGERGRKQLESGAEVQVRYRTMAVKGTVRMDDDGNGVVQLEWPVRAVTPGQISVWYTGDEVIGAGVIKEITGR